MIAYILKSAICLAVLLALYHLLLEKSKMPWFNRFYLLLSLAAGLILPALSIKVSSNVTARAPVLSDVMAIQPTSIQGAFEPTGAVAHSAPAYPYTTLVIMLIYGVMIFVFAARFVFNLVKITRRIRNNPLIRLDGVSLVLLADDVVPHSFFNYIFVNQQEYKGGRIEQQLLDHELTHVRQLHSIDVVLVELLKIIFWFNPVFLLYKNAIQLNHEFLADDAVVRTCDVAEYQYLLLERAVFKNPIPITSNLNFSLTKKRLTMMIKTTSNFKLWSSRLTVLPVLAILLVLFSMKSVTTPALLKPAPFNKKVTAESGDPQKDIFFKDAIIWIKNGEGKYMPKKYEEMTAAEKASLPLPELRKKKIPTEQQLAAWRSKGDVYTICIDNKYANNAELAKYKASDFAYYGIRKPGGMDLRVNKNYGNAPNLVDIRTPGLYNKQFVEPFNKPGKWLGVYEGKIWPGPFDGAATISQYFKLQELKKNNPDAGERWLLPPFKPEPFN